jgi:hypothetical protein
MKGRLPRLPGARLRRLWRMRPVLGAASPVMLGLTDNPGYQWWRDATILQPDSWWGAEQTWESLSAQVALMRELGVAWFRMEAPWRFIAPERPGGDAGYDAHAARDPGWPGYHWESLDRAFALLGAAGIRLLPVLVFAPPWAMPVPDSPVSPPDPTAWADFVTACARRYGRRLAAVELWNEPDHPHAWGASLADYVRLVLRPGAEALRAEAPDCRIVLGGLASAGKLAAIYAQGGGPFFDIASIHVYPTGPWAAEVRAAVRGARAVLRRQGDGARPLWVTEWGVATKPPSTPSGFGGWTSERGQARVIAATHRTSTADALFYYQLRDTRIYDHEGRVLKEVYWGLVSRDLSRRKAGFQAFRRAGR